RDRCRLRRAGRHHALAHRGAEPSCGRQPRRRSRDRAAAGRRHRCGRSAEGLPPAAGGPGRSAGEPWPAQRGAHRVRTGCGAGPQPARARTAARAGTHHTVLRLTGGAHHRDPAPAASPLGGQMTYSGRGAPASIIHAHHHGAERRMPMHALDVLRLGVGGPVGSGKTALVDRLCKALRDRLNMAVVTNDIYTREDAEFLVRSEALTADRIRGVETGGCPHTAIREDASMNLAAIDELMQAFEALDLIIVESGGDNLAATFSPELSDLTLYVIDVSAGDKIPRKGGDR